MKLERKMQKIIERRKTINSGNQVYSQTDFDKLKGQGNKSTGVVTGKPDINDNFLYISRNEHLYRRAKNSQGKSKDYAAEYNIYIAINRCQQITDTSKDCPNWFGVLEKPCNQIPPEKAPTFNGTLTYLSKIQGWITVTPKHKNRTRPIEKMKIVRL